VIDKREIHLDFLRGFAALLVLADHLRAFCFLDFSDLGRSDFFDYIFYFLTGLGHQAVMIFFVLSGFFIGGSVFHKISDGTWGWGDYLANRLSRLWVVLIPALVLTFAFDEAGIFLTGGNGYNGEFNQMIHSGPMLNGRLDTGFLCFLSNLFFLQTIISPVFGSNGPLWSLCNEFWYYIIFPPLVFLFARNKKWMVRIFYFLILILLFCFLPRAILIYGCICLFCVRTNQD